MNNPVLSDAALNDERQEAVDEASTFLEELFSDLTNGLIEIRHLDGRQEWFALDSLDHAADYVARNPINACVGVGIRNCRSGKAEDVSAIPALWADLDKDPDTWKTFPIEPSIVVSSGHGTHAYYLLDNALTDNQLAVAYLKALSVALDSDSKVCEIARVMRVPGGANLKDDLPQVPVRTLQMNPQHRYSLEQMRNAITTAILSKFWLKEQRHNMALALGGYLAKRDVPEHEALELIEELALRNGDTEHRDRARAVSDSYDRLSKGLLTSGYTALSQIIPTEDLEALDGIWGHVKKIDGDTIISLIEATSECDRYSTIVDIFPEISRLPIAKRMIVKNVLKKRFKFTAGDFDELLKAATHGTGSLGTLDDGIEDIADDKPAPEIRREEAEEFGRRPDLLDNCYRDLKKLGLVGEENNAKLAYLCYTTRKHALPINLEARGGTGSGKSFLVEVTVSLMPPEDVVQFSRITAHFIEYLPEGALERKVLIIRERAGSEDADYTLRIITDDTNAVIKLGYLGKDDSGNYTAMERELRGPVVLVETTTKLRGNPENESRKFVIYVDESEEHRKAVHQAIKNSKQPHLRIGDDERSQILDRHQNFQRSLEVLNVVIPYSGLIKFPTKRTRSSRDLKRYLSCLEASALLNQYQRRRMEFEGKEYVIATVEDYRIAHDLLAGTLRMIESELNPQGLEFLKAAAEVVSEKKASSGSETAVTFTRRDVGKRLKWERYQVGRVVEPLELDGWIEVVEKKGNAYRYKLLWEPGEEDGIELLTPEELESEITTHIDEIDPMYLSL